MTKKRGISYTRISTWDQMSDEAGVRKEDASSDMHLLRCRSHVKQLSITRGIQFEILADIADEGYSGANTNRPGYQRLWKLIEKREIDFVITSELSRLSRSVLDFLDFVSHCEKHDVAIMIIGMDVDTTTPFGKFLTLILVALAQFERELTGKRVKENVATRLLKEGKINGAGELLGLVRDPQRKGHFVLDEEGLKNAELIMKLFLKFSSKRKVNEEIKKLGLTGPRGKTLTIKLIDSVLENAKWRYRGLWFANPEHRNLPLSKIPEGELVQLDHGPVLNTELLDAVINKVEDTNEKNKKCGVRGYVYLLPSLLKDEDGNSFTGHSSSGGEYRYYQSKKGGAGIRVDEIDNMVLKRVKEYFENSPLFEKILVEALTKRASEVNLTEKQIVDKRAEISALKEKEYSIREKILTTDLDKDTITFIQESVLALKKQNEQKEHELKELEFTLEHMKDDSALRDIRRVVKEYAHKLDKLTSTQQRAVLEKFIRQIVIKKDGVLKIHLSIQGANAVGVCRNKKAVTMEDGFLDYDLNGGRDGTRTRGLLRDRQTL